MNTDTDERLDVVDVDLPFVPELECTLAVFFPECICLVDLRILWELPVCFYYESNA